jgi:hypothetical protein
MLRHYSVGIIACAVIVSCSKMDSGKKSATVSPEVQLKTVNGKCLNLESAVAQMDATGFDFPGFVYTRSFDVLTQTQPEYADTLIAHSQRANRTRFRGLTELRGLKQEGCEKVRIFDFGGRAVSYNVVSMSPTHLEFELDRGALGEALADLSEEHQKSLLKTPMTQKMKVNFVSPTQVELSSEFETVETECYKGAHPRVHEELVYSWSKSAETGSQSLQVNPAYLERLAASQNHARPHCF